MASISLRDYHRKIEAWIEQGLYDNAISHCRHILNHYPKCLDTYRLLGKAYLESQKLGDANDIFQRVLSSLPDDFISHVGLSIIREDESNLNEAIWHMERAFEIQPSNNAIQGELRRLYGRRDGVEPPKVNLNRSALARMYLKGNLHSQAIAEIRMALAEDPQRPDLEALLAKAYFETNQLSEAKEIANQLLLKLPYCYDALHILWKVLRREGKDKEAEKTLLKLAELDPYAAHLDDHTPSVEMISDTAVTIEQLESPVEGITPATSQQPDWAASLGIEIAPEEQMQSEESLPEWMSEQNQSESEILESGEETGDRFSIQPQESIPAISTSEEIPDWMRELGWEESELPQEQTSEASDVVPFMEDEDIEQLEVGEIPDWLKEITPVDEKETRSFGEDSLESLPFLEESPPGEGDSIAAWLAGLETETQEAEENIELQSEELPDWVNELNNKSHLTAELSPSDDLWSETIESDSAPTEIATPSSETIEQQVSSSPSNQNELPDWLREEEPHPDATELPDWLLDSSETEEETSIHLVEPPISEEDTKPVKTTPKGDSLLEQPVLPMEEDEAFAWLEGLAAKQGAEEALLLSPDERKEEPPEWIREYLDSKVDQLESESLKPETNLASETLTAGVTELESERAERTPPSSDELDSSELPEWLRAELEKEEQPEQSIDLEAESNVPEWISTPSETTEEEWIQEFTSEQIEESEIPETPVKVPTAPAAFEPNPESIESEEPIPLESEHPAEITEELPSLESETEVEPELGVPEKEVVLSTETTVMQSSDTSLFEEARLALSTGQLDEAFQKYQLLVKQKHELDQIIQDLSNALYQYPMEVKMWMLLGDAYLRKDLLSEALDAYNKAEELLR